MAVACASRFSVLKLEDDDMSESVNKKANAQNVKQAGKNNKQNIKTASSDSKTKSKKKKKTATEIAEVYYSYRNHYLYIILIFFPKRLNQLMNPFNINILSTILNFRH